MIKKQISTNTPKLHIDSNTTLEKIDGIIKLPWKLFTNTRRK